MLWKLPQPLFADLAAPPPPLVFIDEQEASNDAQIDISWAPEFERVHVLISDLDPVTANVEFRMLTSSDGGTTFDAGASDYRYIATIFASGQAGFTSNAEAFIKLTDDISNLVRDGAYLITVRRPFDAGFYTSIQSFGGIFSATELVMRGHAWRNEAGRVDALRFLMQTGNISTGRFFAWGSAS